MNMKFVAMGVTAMILAAAFADEHPRYYTYDSWRSTQYPSADGKQWLLDNTGDPVAFPNNGQSWMVMRGPGGGGGEPTFNWTPEVYGLELDFAYGPNESGSGRAAADFGAANANRFEIGAGGVNVKKGSLSVGRTPNNVAYPRVKMVADQTWTGAAAGEPTFTVGGIYNFPTRADCFLMAGNGVTSWTIAGGLNVALFSSRNNLSNVDVVVQDTAKLHLPNLLDARLNAKSLTLSGPGDHMTFGSKMPSVLWNYPLTASYAPTNHVFIDDDHLAPVVTLRDGAGFSAVNGRYGLANINVGGSGESVISGSLVFTRSVNKVTFLDEGASLEFDTVNALDDGIATTSFEIEGEGGTLKVKDVTLLSGEIALAEGQAFAIGGGDAQALSFSGAGTIVIGDGASVYLRQSQIADFTGNIVVKGGMLVLDESLGDRVTVESGEVVYGSDPLIVTDAVKPAGTVTLDEGDTLRVFGNGLTAVTALTINGGVIRFEADATISSALSVTAPGSYIETAAESVTGTMAGFITGNIPGTATVASRGLRTRGEGCVKLTGGGSFSNNRPNTFWTEDGSVWFAGGDWTFRNTSCGMDYVAKSSGPYGKQWLVTGTAKIKLSGYNGAYETELRVSGLENPGNNFIESVLEVRDGGQIEFAENSTIELGYLQAAGRLRIGDGGTVRFTNGSSTAIRMGYSTVTTGIIELGSGGVLETAAPFLHSIQTNYEDYQTQGWFIWNGGTIKLLSGFPATEATLFRNRSTTSWDSVNNSLRVWMKIVGEDCALDLTDLPERETPLANVPAGMERSEWFGTGTLTVKGGKPFVFQSFPNGINLKIEGAGTQVILPTNVEIHDYATCLVNEKVNAGKLHYTTLDKCLQNLALASFTAKGAAGSFVCQKTDCKVTIAEARAAEGGEFVNGMLAAAGGLEVGALTFAENSIVCGDPAAAALAVTGDITLPASLRYAVRKTPGTSPTFTAFTAGGALVGSPTALIPEPGMKSRQVVIDALAKSLGFTSNGLLLLLK